MFTKVVIWIYGVVLFGVVAWVIGTSTIEQTQRDERIETFLVESYCEWATNSSDLETPFPLDLAGDYGEVDCDCLLETPMAEPFMALGRCALIARDGADADVRLKLPDGYHRVHSELLPRFEECVISVAGDRALMERVDSAAFAIYKRYRDCEAPVEQARAAAEAARSAESARQAMLDMEAQAAKKVAEFRRMVAAGIPHPFGIDFLDPRGVPLREATLARVQRLKVEERHVVFLLALDVAMGRATSILLDDAEMPTRLHVAATRGRDLAAEVGLEVVSARLDAFLPSLSGGQSMSRAALQIMADSAQEFRTYSLETRARYSAHVSRQANDTDAILLFALADLMHPRHGGMSP